MWTSGHRLHNSSTPSATVDKIEMSPDGGDNRWSHSLAGLNNWEPFLQVTLQTWNGVTKFQVPGIHSRKFEKLDSNAV
jgi:hypothetical protein